MEEIAGIFVLGVAFFCVFGYTIIRRSRKIIGRHCFFKRFQPKYKVCGIFTVFVVYDLTSKDSILQIIRLCIGNSNYKIIPFCFENISMIDCAVSTWSAYTLVSQIKLCAVFEDIARCTPAKGSTVLFKHFLLNGFGKGKSHIGICGRIFIACKLYLLGRKGAAFAICFRECKTLTERSFRRFFALFCFSALTFRAFWIILVIER